MIKKSEKFILYLILIVLTVITVFPIIYTAAASFKTNIEIMTDPARILPKNPSFENYIQAWTHPDFQFGRLTWNSTYYTVISVFIALMQSSMCGYVFARGNFPFKKVVFACFSALLFIKLGGVSIYATFKVLNLVNLTNSLWALMLVHFFSVPIVNIYLVKGYVEALPNALFEAAKIDGASFIGIFLKIVLPLLKPLMATIAIFAFQASWNDYIMPAIFTSTVPSQRTLMVGLMAIKNSSGAATSWNLLLAGSTMTLIPILVAYGFGNRYFIQGLTAGAVKG